MSTRKQFQVCTGVTLCFKMMQGHVLAMLHSHARPGLPPILIACEAAGLALAGQPVTC
ncbi:phage portal protein BeeE [Xanthomonas arboricola]|uniref:hypothetical protein n=1 Tax=Xanthomonas euroxanthea TaxID=2259622 RepID=UPI00141B0731|nr:hypothetical protein [Xanthomonas euroxanthea]NIK08634.1 phage portal protein BeeE [Xanthomonas euroxanthea]NIK40464.1 phage portal protein BeeE [Xanthomonas euroxanthea]